MGSAADALEIETGAKRRLADGRAGLAEKRGAVAARTLIPAFVRAGLERMWSA